MCGAIVHFAFRRIAEWLALLAGTPAAKDMEILDEWLVVILL